MLKNGLLLNVVQVFCSMIYFPYVSDRIRIVFGSLLSCGVVCRRVVGEMFGTTTEKKNNNKNQRWGTSLDTCWIPTLMRARNKFRESVKCNRAINRSTRLLPTVV